MSASGDSKKGAHAEMTHCIQGEAAGAVIGKAKSTLQLIKDATGCIAIEVGGNRGDEQRPVRIKAHDMETVLVVREIVCGLEEAHDDRGEVERRTMRVETGEWRRSRRAEEGAHLGGQTKEVTQVVQREPGLPRGMTASHDQERALDTSDDVETSTSTDPPGDEGRPRARDRI